MRFADESLAYLDRNYADADLAALPLNVYLTPVIDGLEPQRSVLEVGCGPAANLNRLGERWPNARLVGVEPSAEGCVRLAEAFPHIEFVVNDGVTLPFADDEFDLVIIRSVLHWVDRSVLLQTIGELIRVTRRWLVVSDFSPAEPYSTPFTQHPGRRTWKGSYRPILEASGLVSVEGEWWTDRDDDWLAVETLLCRKRHVDETWPLRYAAAMP